VPSPFPADRPPAAVAGAALRIAYVGHASFLVQTQGRSVLIDPMWSERASPFGFLGPRRANPPGIAFDDLPRIDAVLITHNHYDHMDTETIGRL
jgi:L-ascorbate metabolism protein UlaG (beta-lactamase superfamily)